MRCAPGSAARRQVCVRGVAVFPVDLGGRALLGLGHALDDDVADGEQLASLRDRQILPARRAFLQGGLHRLLRAVPAIAPAPGALHLARIARGEGLEILIEAEAPEITAFAGR